MRLLVRGPMKFWANHIYRNRHKFVYADLRFMTSSLDMPFKGIKRHEFISKPELTDSYVGIPILRQLGYDGKLSAGVDLPFTLNQAKFMYDLMLQIVVCDQMFYDIQRQGRISFYMTNSGEEAAQVGSAAALDFEDVLFLQYREIGTLMYRGFTVDDILSQLFATHKDPGKGRQMPVHYTAKHLNVQSISSPLGTKIPQAAGAGYAFQASGEDKCAVVYFGEGAASEGDFAVGVNFAATLKSQTIFICRNNGFAISTPVDEQYCGDGISSRAIAYGVATLRVDGNDIVAVYNATKHAREYVLREQRPFMLELMTYRVGHHSTSDDSGSYRAEYESRAWQEEGLEPCGRLKRFLINQGVIEPNYDHEFVKVLRQEILRKIKITEKEPNPPIEELFTDVYDNMPNNLIQQRGGLKHTLQKHQDMYDISSYKPSTFLKEK